MKRQPRADFRTYQVRFRYHRPSRYYTLSESSGYPSAEFRMPHNPPDRNRIVVRELQD